MTLAKDTPFLIAQTGPGAGQQWPLDKPALVLGREPDCDIVIPDRQVSRQHVRFSRTEGGIVAEDLASKNGTYLNGALLTGPARLQDGDVLQIALVARLLFVASDATMPLTLDTTPEGHLVSVGRLRLDGASRRVWLAGREILPPLSAPQFRFLELLYQHPGQVCDREAVVQAVWPEAVGAGVSEQAIDALVRRLRDRLAELDPETQYILTVRGHGFRLDNPK